MTVIYDLEHTTTYRYRQPVTFGEHRAIFLPGGELWRARSFPWFNR
jgi:hypothetical protein